MWVHLISKVDLGHSLLWHVSDFRGRILNHDGVFRKFGKCEFGTCLEQHMSWHHHYRLGTVHFVTMLTSQEISTWRHFQHNGALHYTSRGGNTCCFKQLCICDHFLSRICNRGFCDTTLADLDCYILWLINDLLGHWILYNSMAYAGLCVSRSVEAVLDVQHFIARICQASTFE